MFVSAAPSAGLLIRTHPPFNLFGPQQEAKSEVPKHLGVGCTSQKTNPLSGTLVTLDSMELDAASDGIMTKARAKLRHDVTNAYRFCVHVGLLASRATVAHFAFGPRGSL